jgi:hypothetical protein
MKLIEMSSGLPEYRRETRGFTESDTPGLRNADAAVSSVRIPIHERRTPRNPRSQ